MGNKVLFEDCKYRLRLRLREGRWQLVVSNDQHSHELAIDPFSLRQHQWRDPGRLNALSQAQSLRAAGIKYRQALRALNIQGLRLSKDDYYNLSRSEGAHTEEEARQFALGVLKEQGFHVRCFEKNILEGNQVQRRVIEHFFFCNSEQIRLARRFLSHFVVETDATFNTNRLNMPLSVLLGITNTGLSFPAAYCYISSESRESFLFMFACMQELMFYDKCPGPYVILGDFAAGLGAAMMKTLNQNEVPGGEAQIAWDMAQSMDESQTDCTLQLCTWHAAEAIKKKLIKAGTYPLEIRKELSSLIWAWIQSSTLNELESNRQKLLHRLNPPERVSSCYFLYEHPLIFIIGLST